MEPQSTAVHAAIGALKTLATVALQGVQIIDGPRGAITLDTDVLFIGFNPNGPSWLLERGDPDFGGRCEEKGDIVCILNSATGDDDTAARRARVVDMLGALEEAIREDPTLGGAVDAAAIGEAGQGMQTGDQTGRSCTLGFSVRYEAFI